MSIAARDGREMRANRKVLALTERDLQALPDPKRKLAKELMGMLQKLIEEPDACKIATPNDVALQCMDLAWQKQENFVVLFLNSKNVLISRELVSIGTLNAALVHPRDVFRLAIEVNAAAMICVHNHPSGDPSPSPEDISLTKRLMESGQIMGIDVLDHVIIGRDGWVSLKQKELV